jgi:hypothetical protein
MEEITLSYYEWKTEVVKLIRTKPHVKIRWKAGIFKTCYNVGYSPKETVRLAWLQS